MKKNIFDWLNEYSLYHKNQTNKVIHWFCIPLIMLSLFGLLSIPNIQINISSSIYNINLSYILITLAAIFYVRLSLTITVGMLLISAGLVSIVDYLDTYSKNQLFYLYLILFIFSWAIQFIGHKIEGKKPAFIKDLKFLLIGPAWLLSFIYIKLKIKI
tara:strand:+ start:592 stop:1065 length:474 start_codon:yes stop_codon:yes gene_type:complete